MKRPQNLLFAVDESPSLPTMIGLGVQYLATVAIFLILTVLIGQAANATAGQAASLISMTMLASAVAVILQANKRIGSGQLLPLSSAPAIFPPTMLAATTGGLPLVFGMVIFCGVIQAILAYLLPKIRFLFPPLVSGLLIVLIGLQLGILGIQHYFELSQTGGRESFSLGLIVFIAICLLQVFARSTYLRCFALLLVIILGYVAIYALGLFDLSALAQIKGAKWFFLPSLPGGHYAFSGALVVPFIIAAVICALKVIGSLSAIQKLQDDEWRKPNMQSIAKGSFIDGIGSILAGAFGGTGINVSSSSMALTLMTKIASRKIAYYFAAALIIFALCQKLSMLLVYMPLPLIAAALTFLGASLIYAGFKTVMPYIGVPRNAIILGVSFMLGFSYGVYPDFYQNLPVAVEYFTGSALAISAVCAILLNFIFNLSLGPSNHMSFEFKSSKESIQHMEDFMEHVSQDWNVPIADMTAIKKLLHTLAESYAKEASFWVNISQHQQDITATIRCKKTLAAKASQILEGKAKALCDHFSLKQTKGAGLFLKAKILL